MTDLTNKMFEMLEVSAHPILTLDINGTHVMCSDSVGKCSYF